MASFDGNNQKMRTRLKDIGNNLKKLPLTNQQFKPLSNKYIEGL